MLKHNLHRTSLQSARISLAWYRGILYKSEVQVAGENENCPMHVHVRILGEWKRLVDVGTV